MLSKNSSFAIIFLILLFSCPWFLILFQNHSLLTLNKKDIIFSHNQVFVDKTNVLRGQALVSGHPLMGKLFVNKFTIYGKEMTERYLESFDPNFLFFTGGLDKITSTGNSGQIPLSFLPLILYALFVIVFSKKNKYNKIIVFLFVVSPIFSTLFYKHYEWIPKLLFFLITTLFATHGLIKFPKSKRIFLLIILLFWIYETTNFYHKFKNHYTENLAIQIYNIKNNEIIK